MKKKKKTQLAIRPFRISRSFHQWENRV